MQPHINPSPDQERKSENKRKKEKGKIKPIKIKERKRKEERKNILTPTPTGWDTRDHSSVSIKKQCRVLPTANVTSSVSGKGGVTGRSQKFQPISVYGAGHDYALLFVLAAFRIRIVSKAFKPMSNKLKQPLDRTCRSPDLSFMQELLLLVPQAPEILLRASKAGAHA
ncbi:hypothetical protein An16g05220 [Aspergillus niger]|uniref:Uncharacterized protein n=2 Tax=Aspergillus niger TaxID=5061 RepID=A2R7Y8_ASPNC|nr:hypothetical protein An16g05220 [Aspergillus niger]CAK97376.1 hypothetical protein An16g05220 [Aspergillus niger]